MNAISKAIDAADGPTALARKLSELNPARPVTPQRVTNWRARGRVSHDFAIPVELVTGVSRHDLRPDLYPSDLASAHDASIGQGGEIAALEMRENA